MSEVTQTITAGDGSGRMGNCLQAAVASLLDVPLDEVPHFAEKAEWRSALNSFARSRGYFVHTRVLHPPDFGLAVGPSLRSPAHAVVVRDRAIVWDPHPSRAGLRSVSYYLLFEDIG